MRMRFLTVLGLLIVVGSAIADNRLPIPSEDEQGRALKDVKEVFKSEYAKSAPSARVALAEKLLDNGVQTKDDPAARYVLFREARNLAAAAGNANLAMKAADALAEGYAIKPAEARLPALEVLGRLTTTAAAHLDLAKALEETAEEAITADDLPNALKLIRLAGISAGKGKDAALATALSSRAKEFELWQKEFEKVATALELLKTQSDDPDANLLAGRYTCFLKGNWDTGLPLLAKGSDPALKALATSEMANPTTPADQANLADGWFDQTTGSDLAGRMAMRRRARHWYLLAAPELTGLAKIKADKRLMELEKALAAEAGSSTAFWSRLRTVVRDKKYTVSPLCGGQFAKAPFSDYPPEGGVLIGFHYILSKKGILTSFTYFQPIYLTANGEKLGRAYGTARAEFAQTIKAKKGQAISGITIRGGGAMDGFSFTYSPFDRTGWGRGDSTTTEWIGGKGGAEARFGFDGSVIVGVHGKFLTGGEVGGLGVYTANLNANSPEKK
jgi:hypothetical protein